MLTSSIGMDPVYGAFTQVRNKKMSINIAQFQEGNEFVLVCDFCAKPEDKCEIMIASPNASHICGQCVDLCMTVVAEKRIEIAAAKEGSK